MLPLIGRLLGVDDVENYPRWKLIARLYFLVFSLVALALFVAILPV